MKTGCLSGLIATLAWYCGSASVAVANGSAHRARKIFRCLARERLVEPRRRAILAYERGTADAAEIRGDPDVVLLGEPDELLVNFLSRMLYMKPSTPARTRPFASSRC
jgi:hypothetical protein